MMLILTVDVDTENTRTDVEELMLTVQEQGVIGVTTAQGITFDVTILDIEHVVEFIDDLDRDEP